MSIVVPVPTGATSGNVVVKVSNQLSNGVPFTVIIPGSIGGTVTRATGGAAVSGATVQALLAGIVKATATTATNGTYSTGNLDPATYDVRISASTFSPELRQGVTVTSNTTTTLNVTLFQPGAANGVVTQANGTTPIPGAAVTLYQNAVPAATTSTNGSGAYSMSSLHPGAYTLQVASAGYQTSESGISVAENATTTTNVSLNPAVAGQVTYVYDELGRLVSVIDPSGNAANYRYDAVGNILEIDRAGTSTVSISEFTPRSGPIGTTVTIFGTGFSTTPSSNQVYFNGTQQATVTGATANQLTTTVPGPASGKISVTTPSGSATSADTFTVTTTGSLGPPTITSFSPAVWDGTSALTITGTNFDTNLINDRVSLNQALAPPSAATATSLTVPVPASATSGHVVVATVAGTATSTSDFFVPPPGFSSTNLDSTGRVTLGTSQTITFSAANRYSLRLFEGVAGHRVSVAFTNVNVSSGSANLYDPYGRQVGTTGLVFPGNLFIDAVPVAQGTYTLLVSAGSTGNVTATVYDVQDVTGTITADGSTTNVTLNTPGQRAVLAFSTTSVSERLSVVVGGNSVGGTVSLGDARGVTLDQGNIGALTSLIAPLTYPAGAYTVVVKFGGAATGTEAVNLWVVPPDLTGTITPGGGTLNVNLVAPGQQATYTVATPTNTRVSLLIGAGPLGTVTVLNGTTTVTSGSIGALNTFVEPWTFAAGQTISVVLSGAGYGTVPLTAYDVPPDTTGSVTIGGPAALVTTTAGGQNGTLTFSGTMNQLATVHVTNNAMGSLTVRLVDTNGTTVLTSSASIFTNFDLAQVSLPHTGTYTIQIDPSGANTGTVNISVSSP
jgi:YD repeat-containing protein